jgi:CTP synthase
MKYIFFTGGVVSSLGKGLTAASLGTLLERRGLKVILQKFDPYLNVDPGTMSPYQHGEVYVLDDGAETDLDLGHYERFTSGNLSRLNNLTSGQVYETVIKKERKGLYLGQTIQVIPHVTDEIKARIREVAEKMGGDVIITEIGGTVGDIEGLPFLEAMRQFSLEVGPQNVLFVHVTLVPLIRAAGELKTKPTQQSVAKLREIGIQPQIVVCRTEEHLEQELRNKIALFCNVSPKAVIEARDVKHSIYELPLMLHGERFDDLVCEYLGFPPKEPDLTTWQAFVARIINPTHKTRIAVVGKYIELQDAYKSVYEALHHAGAANDCHIRLVKVDAEDLERGDPKKLLGDVQGILIPGGFGDRGIEGKITAARFARENGVPYLGLCLGMQIATVEFARNACGLTGANSQEFDEKSPHPVIHLLEEQKDVEDKGATMRLGTWQAKLKPGTLAHRLYGKDMVNERHRHRFEFNMAYRDQMEAAGFVISGTSPDGSLVEIIEIRDHPYFIASQFHPEFLSKPNAPHPLFAGFVAAARKMEKVVDHKTLAAAGA